MPRMLSCGLLPWRACSATGADQLQKHRHIICGVYGQQAHAYDRLRMTAVRMVLDGRSWTDGTSRYTGRSG